MDVSSHPWVDDVVDVVELWRAHEVCGPRGCDLWNDSGEFDGLRAHSCLTMSMQDHKTRVNANDYAFSMYNHASVRVTDFHVIPALVRWLRRGL